MKGEKITAFEINNWKGTEGPGYFRGKNGRKVHDRISKSTPGVVLEKEIKTDIISKKKKEREERTSERRKNLPGLIDRGGKDRREKEEGITRNV